MSLFAPPVALDEAGLQATMAQIASQMPTPEEQSAWAGSPFERFKGRSPLVVGTMFEKLIHAFVDACGGDVSPRTSSDHDRIICGHKTEIKGATLTPAGTFVFNQIRDQDYDRVALLGLTRSRAHLWVEEKDRIRSLAKNQHGGLEGTKILIVPPTWLGPKCDGTLSVALEEML